MLAQHSGVLGSPIPGEKTGTEIPEVVIIGGSKSDSQGASKTAEASDTQPVHQEVPLVTHNFAYKLLCPRFDGTDFRGWYAKLEQYFEAEMVPNVAKI
ncbi:hypothetical protein HRI_003858800 [Hibiscus trionum]|uniref:Uncharacterized protein n=1 Tax=Hibiscus trionum TaxID=183268 RepID=A0A9W7IT70_HIBTR|nr:hypothetical protein HRI_003858800 [Hibiscus trionum]